ncbi:Uncharacterised protein [uncultured archaeon]|nr:Uncharacterised protein [uncultured archaeon]
MKPEKYIARWIAKRLYLLWQLEQLYNEVEKELPGKKLKEKH